MKKLSLLLALAAALFTACQKSNDDSDKPTTSPFVGNYTGKFLVTSDATAQPQNAQVAITENPDGTLQVSLTVDLQTTVLLANASNAVKIALPDQAFFNTTATGSGQLAGGSQLILNFSGTAFGPVYTASFTSDR